VISLDVETTIGQLVRERSYRVRVFEKLGIDFCCGGAVPLAQACARKGLSVDEVIRALQDADAAQEGSPETAEWMPATLADRIDRIVAVHHGHLRRELPRLTALLEKVASAHGTKYPELGELCEVFCSFRADLESHILKEEWSVFPAIKRLETATALRGIDAVFDEVIRHLEDEHEAAGAALVRMRTLTHSYSPPADACNTYRIMLGGLANLERDTLLHVHEENNLLFPLAREAATALRTRSAADQVVL
jgi:regulator of cell morphogenesis and NO signaling